MGVEVVEHEMNGPRLGIRAHDGAHHARERCGGGVRCRAREVPTGFRLDHGEDVGRAAASIFVVALGDVARPGGPWRPHAQYRVFVAIAVPV